MDYWKKSLEFPCLVIFVNTMVNLTRLWDYMCLIWSKVVLGNKNTFKLYHEFPHEIREIGEDLKKKMQEDFAGSTSKLLHFHEM